MCRVASGTGSQNDPAQLPTFVMCPATRATAGGPHVVAPECPHHGALLLLLLVLQPVMSKAVRTRLSALGRLIA
jgi:hypothetical protein